MCVVFVFLKLGGIFFLIFVDFYGGSIYVVGMVVVGCIDGWWWLKKLLMGVGRKKKLWRRRCGMEDLRVRDLVGFILGFFGLFIGKFFVLCLLF